MTQLMEALLAGNNQTPTNNLLSKEQSAADAFDAISQDNPMGQFIAQLLRIVESKGLDLDQIMGKPSVEDDADMAGDPDPLELLTEEEILSLAQKFLKLPPDQQQQLEQGFIENLPPQTVNRLRAALRFAQQRMSK